MFKQILVATDGSAASEHAASLAVSLAHTHHAQLVAIYVVDPYPYLGIGEANPYGFESYMSAARQVASETHTKVAALCAQQEPPVQMQASLVEGASVTAGILQSAHDHGADLIVIGSHGRTGIRRLVLGSTANKIVAESLVPVLVTR